MYFPFCSMEPSEEPGPSTLQVYDPQPESSEFSLPAAAAAATQTPSLQDRRLELTMDVFRQQKKVICLQEEYHRLKIELLKNKSKQNVHYLREIFKLLGYSNMMFTFYFHA